MRAPSFPLLHAGACAAIVAAFGASSTLATAAEPAAKAKAAAARPAAKPAGRKAAVPEPAPVVVADATPEQVLAAEKVYYGQYECEFQQTVNIQQSAKHSAYVDVKAGRSLWLMKPVLSSTGAIRLEDVGGETLMVQISSKSMLLNVKTARRIVDDCVSPRQRELMEEAKLAKAAAAAAAANGGAAPTAPADTPVLLRPANAPTAAPVANPAQAPSASASTPAA